MGIDKKVPKNDLWGSKESCASGHFAKQMKLKIDYPEKGKEKITDSTGLNAIKLICDDDKVITSLEGEFGAYESWSNGCSSGNYIVGIKMRIEEYRDDLFDDSAINGVKFKCSDRDWNSFLEYSPGDGYVGNWTDYGYCQKGYAIAALSTRVVQDLGSPSWYNIGYNDKFDAYDDVSMTHVKFFCKKIPVPVHGKYKKEILLIFVLRTFIKILILL